MEVEQDFTEFMIGVSPVKLLRDGAKFHRHLPRCKKIAGSRCSCGYEAWCEQVGAMEVSLSRVKTAFPLGQGKESR